MDAAATAKIPRAFADLPDPRKGKNITYRLIDLLTMALFAVICGADGWEAVAQYAKAKRLWLGTFLDLPYAGTDACRTPEHETFSRVFAALDPDAFEACFRRWTASLAELSGGKLVAIDGKSLRRSSEHAWGESGMPHLVSAFIEANQVVFAQQKTDGKGRELDAIHKLLATLQLNGAVVTIDALGCQKSVAQRITANGGNYVLQVKKNQEKLLDKLKATMDDAILDHFAGMSHDRFEQSDGDHGRIEMRTLWVSWDVHLLGPDLLNQWPGLKAMIALDRRRELNGKVSLERHYYIASLDKRTRARHLLQLTRGHWSVENNTHWQLDVSFQEDQRRIRKGHGAENFSRLCRIALNQLVREKSKKTGIAIKRQTCGWDNDYLLRVLLA
jgi:predicted transposase YbfD/YdcC